MSGCFVFLRVAVAENPSDVHFSHGSVHQRNVDHLRAEAHHHHHTSWTSRLMGGISSSMISTPDYSTAWYLGLLQDRG